MRVDSRYDHMGSVCYPAGAPNASTDTCGVAGKEAISFVNRMLLLINAASSTNIVEWHGTMGL
jgi:hypothetical protein